MRSKLSDELTMLTTRLMMCGSKREVISLSTEFGKLIEKVMEHENVNHVPEPKQKATTATIKFTKEEVAKMAKTFKKEFIANGLVARIIKRQSGKRTFLYEIRYRRNGYDISASSTDLKEAKRKFLEMTLPENIWKYAPHAAKTSESSLIAVATDWLKTKEGTIDSRTLRDYKMNCELRIFPTLGKAPISSIKTIDIKNIIDAQQGKVIETLQIIFNGIMRYAVANGLIPHNPMQALQFKKAPRNTRRALTKDEEQKFLSRVDLPEFSRYRKFLLLEYYFGLRPWELTDLRVEGDFLIALNAKHKDTNGEPVYKKIPIPAQARVRLNFDEPLTADCSLEVINRKFKKIIEDQTVTQYYLRHTFATTCQQYVRPDIVDIWMGDSPQRLVGKVYTNFPDEFMIEQMKLVTFGK